jgi:ketosteroid isomerase-like protein
MKKQTTTQSSTARIIKKYVAASNKHDVKSILACFADTAVVHDEGEKLRGKKLIEGWVTKTIKKYKFHFKLLGVKGDDAKAIAEMEVSGTFDGSPVTLDYHFIIKNEKISSLAIK